VHGSKCVCYLAEKAQWMTEFQKNAVADKETREFLYLTQRKGHRQVVFESIELPCE
jgi:hypothetical protein